MKKILFLLSFVILVLAGCGPSPAQIATQTALSDLATRLAWTPTPDFTGRLFPNGTNMYSGPGMNYQQIGSVLGSVEITGQAYGCSWFQVVSPTDNSAGWIRADQVSYTVSCADVPGAQVPTIEPTITLIPSPTYTLIPTATFTQVPTIKPSGGSGGSQPVANKCNVASAMTIGNRTGATATFKLVGPGTFYVTLPPDQNTSVPVCEGCYDVYVLGACGDASGTMAFRLCDGFNGWIYCK